MGALDKLTELVRIIAYVVFWAGVGVHVRSVPCRERAITYPTIHLVPSTVSGVSVPSYITIIFNFIRIWSIIYVFRPLIAKRTQLI